MKINRSGATLSSCDITHSQLNNERNKPPYIWHSPGL